MKTRLAEALVRSAGWARRHGFEGLVDAISVSVLERRVQPGRSASDDESALHRLLASLGVDSGFMVDIAACDGVTNSNSLGLYRDGWRGLAVEGDGDSFSRLAWIHRRAPDVALARLWVTPHNVASLLRAYDVPDDFEVLNLDIDGYDHFVLAALLAERRPLVICAEINEAIPPPIKFTVRYDPAYRWEGGHFYGQSLSKLCELADAQGYALASLHYNNAFLVRTDRAAKPGLTPEAAYRSGYLDPPDRTTRFPWNAAVDELQSMSPADGLEFLRRRFAAHEGQYELSL
jgi:hypothetical protein